MDRYRIARAKGRFQEAVDEDANLLAGFGLGLMSVENGLRVVVKKSLRQGRINPWDVIPIHPKLWKALRPLLVELHELRAEKAKRLSAAEAVSASVRPKRNGKKQGSGANGKEAASGLRRAEGSAMQLP